MIMISPLSRTHALINVLCFDEVYTQIRAGSYRGYDHDSRDAMQL